MNVLEWIDDLMFDGMDEDTAMLYVACMLDDCIEFEDEGGL